MFLLLALFSPVTELFPNLYMSWWKPSNDNLREYQRTWYRRIGVVLVVWVPILFAMSRIAEWPLMVVMAFIIFGAFAWRLVTFTKQLEAEIDGTSSTVDADLPERLYFVALTILFVTIYVNIPDNAWRVPVGAAGIFIGALVIGRFRSGPSRSQIADIVGRIIFSAGFILNLHNLARASELI